MLHMYRKVQIVRNVLYCAVGCKETMVLCASMYTTYHVFNKTVRYTYETFIISYQLPNVISNQVILLHLLQAEMVKLNIGY